MVEQQTEKLVCTRRVGSLSMHFLVYGLGDSQYLVQRVVRGGYTVGPRVDPVHRILQRIAETYFPTETMARVGHIKQIG